MTLGIMLALVNCSILGQISLPTACQDIYKLSAYIHSNQLQNFTQNPSISTYKCKPSLKNKFCGDGMDNHPEDWKLFQPCLWGKLYISCPLYLKKYKSYWDYSRWNRDTVIVQARGYVGTKLVFTTEKATIKPVVICDNYGKMDPNHQMFHNSKLVVQ